MIFWKTKLLVNELKENSLAESALKNYYLATGVVSLLGYYAALLQPRENIPAIATEAIGSICVTIVGLNSAFNANGGSAGVNFLNKAVSIMFPLLIKAILAGMVLGIGQAIFEGAGASHLQSEWLLSIGLVAIQAVLFWRLTVHVKSTCA